MNIFPYQLKNNNLYIKLHRISNLHDAFNRRAGKLTFSIENNLREKGMLLGA